MSHSLTKRRVFLHNVNRKTATMCRNVVTNELNSTLRDRTAETLKIRGQNARFSQSGGRKLAGVRVLYLHAVCPVISCPDCGLLKLRLARFLSVFGNPHSSRGAIIDRKLLSLCGNAWIVCSAAFISILI